MNAIVMVICGLAAVVLFAKAKELGEKPSKRELAKETGPTKELLSEGHFEPVPTVKEHTTELLVEKRER